MVKQSMRPGSVPFSKVRQLVNAAIKARRGSSSSAGFLLPEKVRDRLYSLFPTAYAHEADPARSLYYDVGSLPRYPVFRGSVMPDMSFGGHTSSSRVVNIGPNIRHITPDLGVAAGYGSAGNFSLVEAYNAIRVPGLLSGKLKWGTNRFVAGATRGLSDFGGMFHKDRPHYSRGYIKSILGERMPDPDWRRRLEHTPLGYESALDANRVAPSRVYHVSPLWDYTDVTPLYMYARDQKFKLPNGFNLHALVRDRPGWWHGLTPQQSRAAKRYRAVYDLLSLLAEWRVAHT